MKYHTDPSLPDKLPIVDKGIRPLDRTDHTVFSGLGEKAWIYWVQLEDGTLVEFDGYFGSEKLARFMLEKFVQERYKLQ